MKIAKRTLLAAGAAVALTGIGGYGVQAAHAATMSEASGHASLAQKIAQKFNLKESEVQQVFDQDHADRDKERHARMEERLTQAVADGKLTAAQKDTIVAKMGELEKQREAERTNFQNKTPEERRAAMDQHRAELEQWAKDNGIPTEFLRMGGGMRGGPRADI